MIETQTIGRAGNNTLYGTSCMRHFHEYNHSSLNIFTTVVNSVNVSRRFVDKGDMGFCTKVSSILLLRVNGLANSKQVKPRSFTIVISMNLPLTTDIQSC